MILDIPGYPGYRADSNGDIWSCLRTGPRTITSYTNTWKKLTKTKRKSDGRYVVGVNNKRIVASKLIILAFKGPPPLGKNLCRHFNDDKSNNKPSNLFYGNDKDNSQDSIRNKKFPIGENSGRSKISDEEIYNLRKMYSTGNYTQAKLSSIFNICNAHVSEILRNKLRKLKSNYTEYDIIC